MNARTNIACLLLLVAQSTNAFSQERGAKIKQIVFKIVDAKYSHRRSSLYRSLFAAAGKSGLPALKRSRHDSIAIQAAWREVALTVPAKKSQTVYRPDQKKLTWFIGFLEGRSRATVPKWWAEVVRGARAHRRDNIYSGKLTKWPYHNAGLKYVHAPIGTTIRKDAESYNLQIGKDSIAIPNELLRKSDDGTLSCNINGHFTSTRCFLAVHDDVGFPHVVACINRKTGKTVWKSKACGCLWGNAMGQHISCVAVVVHDDRVVVFGYATMGFYAHGFRSDNGKTLFQFSSSFGSF